MDIRIRQWLGCSGRMAAGEHPFANSHIPQKNPGGDAEPVAVPLFVLEAGDEEFPGIHEAGEDLVEPEFALVAQGPCGGDASVEFRLAGEWDGFRSG